MRAWYAFDPGTTTGVAWYTDAGQFCADQLSIEDLYSFVDGRCEEISHAQIEKFTITARTTKTALVYDPLDVIGYLKYAAWRCGFPWKMSQPADVMKSFPDATLKRAGFHTKGKGHANDAARHLCRALIINRVIDPKVFLP